MDADLVPDVANILGVLIDEYGFGRACCYTPDSEALDEFEFTLLNFIGLQRRSSTSPCSTHKIKNIAHVAFRSHHTIDNKFGLKLTIKQRCAYPYLKSCKGSIKLAEAISSTPVISRNQKVHLQISLR